MLTIAGVAVEDPITFQVVYQDIDGETYRDASGQLHRDRLATKIKLKCSWGVLDPIQTSQLLNAVQDQFFDVNYPDPKLGDYTTKTCYVGDRTSPILFKKDDKIYWKDISFDLTEQ